MSTKRTFPSRKNNQLFHFTDWTPTILGLGGIQAPVKNDVHEVDGLDFSEDLFQESPPEKRSNFIIAVRHVLSAGKWHMQYAARYGQWKIINYVSVWVTL